ncbi:MAG: arsenosugar biosynthesis radical SAM protein ArsS [Phycisphaerales bacterium]
MTSSVSLPLASEIRTRSPSVWRPMEQTLSRPGDYNATGQRQEDVQPRVPCHVEAGPNRTEIMDWPTMEKIVSWLKLYKDELGIEVVDLTGGAPGDGPHFRRRLVIAVRALGLHVIDRCNLTILLEPGYEDMASFLAEHKVEVSASLPCYLEDNVDKQRGRGVYGGSIKALQMLNGLGYGKDGTGLKLDLVYNPVGYGLPPAQGPLEADYKKYLHEHFGIAFNKLWTITNMPIKRFEHALKRDGKYDEYMGKLTAAHNGANVAGVMCRDLVSVGWRGSVYDCDFNQMLQMPIAPGSHGTIYGPGSEEHIVESESKKLWDYTPEELIGRSIRTGSHCFGCTAGAGSSCTGALA